MSSATRCLAAGLRSSPFRGLLVPEGLRRQRLGPPSQRACFEAGRRTSASLPQRGAVDALLSPSRVHDVLNPRLGMADGERASWVSDVGSLLDKDSRADVDALCDEVHASWCVEVAVVVLSSLPEDVHPSAFAAALLNYWGVGDVRLRTGLLVMLLLGQRRLEMRVGYGTQRVFSPETLKAIQEERMVPHLRAGAPGAALREGLRGIQAALDAKGPQHWRRSASSGPAEYNRQGFGGGQTPIDDFKPKDL
uniref:TPM domain-containing protein n=1 Tax=Alexandrium monilatum TaxID=311494 RepID=A0A7S4RPK7_9DINO|mmetsp:Transcript_86263/g.257494  ORF Transcript_86263/g.257494 Transcript_86263/m.257494 type:complete len:250 (-) Transcript_86263:38-787(-)